MTVVISGINSSAPSVSVLIRISATNNYISAPITATMDLTVIRCNVANSLAQPFFSPFIMSNPIPGVDQFVNILLNSNDNIYRYCPNHFFSIKNSDGNVIYTNRNNEVCFPSPCITWLAVDTAVPYTGKLTIT